MCAHDDRDLDLREEAVISAATPRRLAAFAAIFLAVVTPVFGAASAPAGNSIGCAGKAERPFLRWLDLTQYTLAPSGDFEGGRSSDSSGWKLTSGAKVVSGNEPFKVHHPTDAQSLYIPAGGSATSPAFCIGLLHPTLRLFAVGGNVTSMLKLEIVYQTAFGTITQPVTLILARGTWGPTPPALILANVTGLLALDGLTSSVQLRFTALGSAGWNIDDVYVDPWKVT